MPRRPLLHKDLLIVAICLGLNLGIVRPSRAQDPTPPASQISDQVRALIARMSVQQRVGQLFVVSFRGTNVAPTSDIADLIQNYRVGGVQLMAQNSNFSRDVTDPPTPQQVAQLANALQALSMPENSAIQAAEEVFVAPSTRVAVTASTASTGVTQTITATLPVPIPTPMPTSIPMFVTLSQEADWTLRLELSEITRGITQIPSQMAIGATWNPAASQSAGEILGNELSQLGINVLFGPTLDVVDVPRPNTPGDLGTHMFGGDPYWVGRLGQAFVIGLHRGSGNRMAVVARNFPGLGSSDRNINDEIPTVQKSLEQLKQIELAPFFAVTKGDAGSETTADGLLVSHIRYRGFQGNIRASTRPVSFDPQAYQALMALPEIAPWRASGGVTFSDELGVRAVSRFYDPLETSFNARRIAQEAFAAGNDVLLLGNFGLSNSWPEQLANIKDTIRFFQTKYVEDPNFAVRVDESLARIMALKLRLYGGTFSRDATQVSGAGVALLQPQDSVTAAIAKESITLLSPSMRDLPTMLPTAPTKDESIVFLSDDRQIRECAECEPYPAVPPNALEDIALALYGPRTTGQVDPARMSSFTFSDLDEYNARTTLAVTPTSATGAETQLPTFTAPAGEPIESTPQPPQTRQPPLKIETAIERASWIVIAMLDTNPFVTSTLALRTFLAQSTDTLKDKRVIVFALGAPYYLDATEISKVTAFYGVFSRTQVYLEAAMRALFGEFVPMGDSPVSIPALNYFLIVQTAPDPTQVIPLIPLTDSDVVTDTQATPVPLTLKIGDKLKLRAGPIYDKNGRVVPDNTEVQFILSYPTERVEQRLPAVFTHDGLADTTVALERQGKLEIRAEADPATTSYVVLVDTTDVVSIETIKPTAAPTRTPQPAATMTERPSPAATVAPSLITPPPAPPPRSSLAGFLLTLIGLLGISAGMFVLMAKMGPAIMGTVFRLRVALGLWTLGWLAYSLAVLGFPGTRWATEALGWGGSALIAIALTLAAAGVMLAIANARKPRMNHPQGSL